MVQLSSYILRCPYLSKAPAVVEHGGDAVEPEAVEAVDVDPHAQVGQQEAENLIK